MKRAIWTLLLWGVGLSASTHRDHGLVDELQKALDDLREEGFIDRVVSKYLN